MSHFADTRSLARHGAEIVKLFDGFGRLGPFDQPGDAVEAPVSDNGNDLERVTEVGKRVAVDENEVRNRPRGNPAQRRVDAERSGGIHTGRTQCLLGSEPGSLQRIELRMNANARRQAVRRTGWRLFPDRVRSFP